MNRKSANDEPQNGYSCVSKSTTAVNKVLETVGMSTESAQNILHEHTDDYFQNWTNRVVQV